MTDVLGGNNERGLDFELAFKLKNWNYIPIVQMPNHLRIYSITFICFKTTYLFLSYEVACCIGTNAMQIGFFYIAKIVVTLIVTLTITWVLKLKRTLRYNNRTLCWSTIYVLCVIPFQKILLMIVFPKASIKCWRNIEMNFSFPTVYKRL